MMKFKRVITSVIFVALSISSLTVRGDKLHRLGDVTVWGNRPMKEIGVQKTTLDSTMLKENVALSLADVLTFNSSIFVKSYGRATLSTVAFRGTSPSHTQVTWNGMKINSPMLGMTDFSTIPSFFIDKATLLHGTSSVNESGGGLGGLVRLGTTPEDRSGLNLQYVQGIGSFRTFDEYLRLTYGSDKWQISTRAVCSSSANDYKYVNHDKKENIYDADHNIIGQYHPTERNRSGAFRDVHLLQEIYYNISSSGRLGLNAWYMDSNRELPMLTTDYGDETRFENRQRERTFRGVLSWEHHRGGWKSNLRTGYIHTWMAYDYKRDLGNGTMASMTRSRSNINTIYGQAEGEYNPSRHWFFNANVALHQHFVRSADKNIILQDGDKAIVGYDKGRVELSASVSAKWQPVDRFGMSVVVREELAGRKWAPVIPALFVDALLSRKANVMLRASVSRNYRFPTLNDLYFLPGGNPNLRNEHGVSYDAGISFDIGKPETYHLGVSLTWFDSYVDNWIIWLPTTKGFFSPRNVKQVHSYGVEFKGNFAMRPAPQWTLELNGSLSWTPSINRGQPYSDADQSVGKQLPYVPRFSSSVTGRLSWQTWSFLYKWCWYSERFTMSSNEYTITGHLPPYFMSNVSLEKSLTFKPVALSLKLAVNNLFNEHYLSVLSRPMPGINFEFFISVTPRFCRASAPVIAY